MGFRIVLSNPYRSYFPGQPVEGRLIVENAKPDKVKEVLISLKGRARVQWSGGDSYSVDKKTKIVNGQPEVQRLSVNMGKSIHYHAEVDYLSYVMVLAGDGENSIIIPEGTNSYRFRFMLPHNLPSSFTSHVGQVYYFLKGTIRRSLFISDDTTKLPFTVNGIFDLNLEVWANQPQQYRGRKGSNRCICRKGHLSFDLNLPTRSGFVSGEKIDFTVMMSNRSNRKATLCQIAKFYAKGQTKILKRQIMDVKGPAVEEGECEVWEASLNIPGVPPTKLGWICGIIDVQYCLELEMKISGLSDQLRGMLPVLIGTIPLRTTFGDFQRARPNHSSSSSSSNAISYSGPSRGTRAPYSTSVAGPSPLPQSACSNPPGYNEVVPSTPIFANYPDLPPPSYVEALVAEGFRKCDRAEIENDNEDRGQGEQQSYSQASSSQPSARSLGGFVPVYVTYSIRV